jgi:hydrogenase maturation protein HypF
MAVALGGGCLVNRLLRDGLRQGLEEAGFKPLLATSVPPGDGGLAYGQAVVAAVAGARGAEPRDLGGRAR